MKAIRLFDVDAIDAKATRKMVKAMLAHVPMVKRVVLLPAPRLLGKQWLAVETENGEREEAFLAAICALQALARYTLLREFAR